MKIIYVEINNNYVSILIDHDRIFGTNEGIQRLDELRDNFECIRGYGTGTNEFLYSMIKTDEQKELIVEYSKEIEALEEEVIESIFDELLESANAIDLKSDDVRSHIINFLTHRKSKIVNALKEHSENRECYGE